MSKDCIQDRIHAAFRVGEHELHYHDLALRVFPEDQYPKAWNYQSNGGPPGCYMALSAALRRMDVYVFWTKQKSKKVRRPYHNGVSVET